MQGGGICWMRCPKNECGAFCGEDCTNSADFTPRDFYGKRFSLIITVDKTCPKGYYRERYLCHRDCCEIGYFNCNSGTCSINKYCEFDVARFAPKFVDYIVKYLGYVYSIKSSTPFDYTDKSNFQILSKEINKVFYENYISTQMDFRKFLTSGNDDYLHLLEGRLYNFIKPILGTEDKKILNNFYQTCRLVFSDWKNKFTSNVMNLQNEKVASIEFAECKSENLTTVEQRSKCLNKIVALFDAVGALGISTLSTLIAKPVCSFPDNQIVA